MGEDSTSTLDLHIYEHINCTHNIAAVVLLFLTASLLIHCRDSSAFFFLVCGWGVLCKTRAETDTSAETRIEKFVSYGEEVGLKRMMWFWGESIVVVCVCV